MGQGLLSTVVSVLEAAPQKENHGDDVSWVVSTPRSSVPVSLHLMALQLKPSLSGLRALEHPLFTHTLLISIQGYSRLISRGMPTTPSFVGPF